MESYFGLTADEWYNNYQKEGMNIFKNKNIKDSEILELLGRCCIGFESITPTLKKSGWTIDRFIEAEKEYGIDPESLNMVIGEYLVIDEIDYQNMTPFEIREYIDSNYSIETLSTQGASHSYNSD